MQDQYEHRFGIFDHSSSQNRPLSSVAMFECENYTERSAYYDALLEYAEGNYKEIWGLNIDEFLNRPQYIVKMMRMATEEVMKKKINVINDVSSQVKTEHNNPRKRPPR